jgi:asparagine synthase (glutamine-hydrolysing)
MAPEISSAIDPHFIGDFLLQAWCADPERTAFRDIRRLPSAHLLEFAEGKPKLQRFTTLPIEEPLFFKQRERYVEEFRAHFRAAVRDRLPRAGAAIFMSGGLDSTSVAAQAAQIAKETGETKLHALTLDCRPLFADEEGVLASRVAEYCGISSEIVSMAKTIPFGNWEGEEIRSPEPSGEPYQAANAQLYRRAAAHARVALNGEGGDAILTDQARSYLGYLLRQGRVAKLTSELGGYILKHRRLPFLGTGLRGRLRRWFGSKEREVVFPDWIEPNFEEEMHLKERWKELNRPPESSRHPLHPEAYASLTGTFWALLLEEQDAGWSGAPVEIRSPFLDVRLIRFLLRVPPLPWCMQKELLREATRGILPEEIRLRPKVPLLEDPLPLLMEKGSDNRAPLSEPDAKSGQYVNWLKVRTTSSGDTGYALVEKMRPVALEKWLKGVEKQ